MRVENVNNTIDDLIKEIHRLEEENKNLKDQFRYLDIECERLEKEVEEKDAEIERLCQPILMAENVEINTEELLEKLRTAPTQILPCDDSFVKSKAIEEFWTKVRAYAVVMGCYHIVEYGDDIVKEMVEVGK